MASWKQILPTSLGLVVLAAALIIVAAAMFLSGEGGEKLAHLYKDLRDPAAKPSLAGESDSGKMEVFGRWRGVTFVPPTSPTARSLGVRDAEGGVAVAEVAQASEAARSGILAADVIVGVDKKPIRDLTDLYNSTQTVAPLSPVLLDVRRGGQPATLVLPPASTAAVLPGAPAREQEATPAALRRPTFFCPRDGVVITGQATGSPYACPRCRGPMQFYPQATP
jgi:hypothetical protein